MSQAATADSDDRKQVWNAAEGKTSMLVTRAGTGLHARPMSAILRPDDGLIWFLSDVDTGKLDEIEADPGVAVTFSDGGKTHVAIHGAAIVIDDRTVIENLWSAPADAFYPEGAADPRIRAIRVEPSEAELWESPGRLLALFRMAAAVATGTSARGMASHVKTEI